MSKINRSNNEPMSEINVTPFVDVMLVLLIIFMVTTIINSWCTSRPESGRLFPDDQEPLQ